MPDIEWISKGSLVPAGTLTESFNKHTKEDRNFGILSDWVGGQYQLEIEEEVVSLGDYGKTLTIITVIQDIEEYEENANIDKYLQAKFRR